MHVQGIRSLFRFPGYVLKKIRVGPEATDVELKRDGRYADKCPECGSPLKVNRRDLRCVRDLPIGCSRWVYLRFPIIQGYCAQCKSFVTLLPEGLRPNAQASDRLKAYVSALARHMPLRSVAELMGISESNVYRWDREVLEKTLPPPKLDGLKYLLVDEKAVRRGHNYVTLVMNGESGELLYIAEGKKKESLEGFFAQLNQGQKATVKAVAMDRTGSYYQVVREQLPKADIVFDKFHLIANFNGVIDEVRRSEWRKADREGKAIIKGQRFNLYRPWDTAPTEAGKYSLAILILLNINLQKVYVLKEALREVWNYSHRGYAKRYLEKWLGLCEESGLAPVLRFAKGLSKVVDEVVNYTRHGITNGLLEGFNNQVSRIIHRACGVRNMDYLFLKLRQLSIEPNQRR